MKHYETLFSPFLVAVTLITVVTVKLHRTMAKGERWVQARSPSLIPLEAQNFAV